MHSEVLAGFKSLTAKQFLKDVSTSFKTRLPSENIIPIPRIRYIPKKRPTNPIPESSIPKLDNIEEIGQGISLEMSKISMEGSEDLSVMENPVEKVIKEEEAKQ